MKNIENYLKSVGVTDSELRASPLKAAWVYKHTLSKSGDKEIHKRLSKTWENIYSKNIAKYEKGGVLKFQSGKKLPGFLTTPFDDGRTPKSILEANAMEEAANNINARRNQLDALKAADTPYKPEYSFKPQLDLGTSNELDFNNYKKPNNFFTTYKTPEQIKADKQKAYQDNMRYNTQKLSPLSSNVNKGKISDPVANIVSDIFNKGTQGTQRLGPSERQASEITIPQKNQPVFTKELEGIEKQLPKIDKIEPYKYKGSGGAIPSSVVPGGGDAVINTTDNPPVEPPVEPKGLLEKIRASIKKKYTDTSGGNSNTEGNAPWLSKTGINTPLGEVQYNDIAQYYLAKRARDRKVGDVPLNLKKHIDKGSDNVMAARDIDRGMLNEAEQEIAKISSGYKGSDPLMAMVSNQMAGERKSKARLGLISERAAFRAKEKERVFNDINASNKQKSADNVRANETRFDNNQLKFEAELAAVTAKAAREAKFDNVRGKLSSNLQSRANTNASLGKSLVTEAEVLDRQRRNNLAQSKYKTSSIAYLNATQLPADEQDKELIANLKTQMDGDFELARGKTYDRNKAIQDYNRISKGTSKLQLGNSIFKNLFGK